jgi:glycerol-3-phosphate acyltransferase PlsY
VNWTGASIAVLGAYLLGSVPFGFLAGKLKGIDIRAVGSGNIGATNVGRALGRRWSLFVFGLDLLKGYVPTVAAKMHTGDWAAAGGPGAAGQLLVVCIGMSAVLGHMFPVFLGFRGGKGVATGLGLLLAINLPAAVIALGTWLVALGLWGYVSLASIVAAATYPMWYFGATRISGNSMRHEWWVWGFTTLLCVLMIVRHRSNVVRLLAGTESRIRHWGGRPKHPSEESA